MASKNSILFSGPTRYSLGAELYDHKGRTIISSVGSADFDAAVIEILNGAVQLGSIPVEFSNRPDLISYAWFGTPMLWWQVMIMNNLFDPFESLNSGDPILVTKS